MAGLALDETHDPRARSWVDSAAAEGCDFPIQNLPLGVFRSAGATTAFRGGVAIGDLVVALADCVPLLDGHARIAAEAGSGSSLAPLMALGPADWTALRRGLFALLRQGSPAQEALTTRLLPMAAIEMGMPTRPGAFVDFFASIQHATNAGRRTGVPLTRSVETRP